MLKYKLFFQGSRNWSFCDRVPTVKISSQTSVITSENVIANKADENSFQNAFTWHQNAFNKCQVKSLLISLVSLGSWFVFNQVKPKKERCQVVNNFILYLVLCILWGASADENSTLQLQIRRLKQLLKTIKKSN